MEIMKISFKMEGHDKECKKYFCSGGRKGGGW